ncbi:hypothetical protein T36_1286 [Helicobacter cinaedi]|uniref:YopX family protein n=1 Tax=Helicobacter cinaedi TaxID=213 RepID=UPI001F1C78C0|nr:YopX family protein [Helicobacter cinaedi]BDB64829.1 hypothetical protein T36_1286 [Helicobacter cinaedi]
MKLQDFDARIWSKANKQYYSPQISFLHISDESNSTLERIPAMSFINKKGEYLDRINLSLNDLELELYTGLKDCEGVEIYEGDILAHFNHANGIEYYSKVTWNQRNARFELIIIEHPADPLPIGDVVGYIQIVGNIHENKDLLEEAK